jgi:hypothetical protein
MSVDCDELVRFIRGRIELNYRNVRQDSDNTFLRGRVAGYQVVLEQIERMKSTQSVAEKESKG